MAKGNVAAWQHSAFLPYPAAFLHQLILDVEKYPEFLPGCQTLVLLGRQANCLQAYVTLGHAGLSFGSYTSLVSWGPETIDIQGTGSFYQVHSQWYIRPVAQGTHLQFDLEIIFSHWLKRQLFRAALPWMTQALIEAFSQRAATLFTEENP